MGLLKSFYVKHKEVILYLIFGVLTTLVNFITYYVLVFSIGLLNDNMGFIFNVIANVMAILFAYVTNRKFVFESKKTNVKEIIGEMFSFFSCRIFAMIVDSLIYYVGCNIMRLPDFIVKSFSQVVIIILNYVSSKLITFRKRKE